MPEKHCIVSFLISECFISETKKHSRVNKCLERVRRIYTQELTSVSKGLEEYTDNQIRIDIA